MGRRGCIGIAMGSGLQVPRGKRSRCWWRLASDGRNGAAVRRVYGSGDERFDGHHFLSRATVRSIRSQQRFGRDELAIV